MGENVPEPDLKLAKPTVSDAELDTKLDTVKAEAAAAKDAEVTAAQESALAASKQQKINEKKEAENKKFHSKDEIWTLNMPSSMLDLQTSAELDIATEAQINFARQQYRAKHM